MPDIKELHVRREDGSVLKLTGRVAWAAKHLLDAGETGVTPIVRPAPRWSDYVFRLRGMGLIIETIDEPHGGTYRGHHARYVWRTPVKVVKAVYAGEDRDAA
jgi:hypothetical protein